jgi:hypothetical protein
MFKKYLCPVPFSVGLALTPTHVGPESEGSDQKVSELRAGSLARLKYAEFRDDHCYYCCVDAVARQARVGGTG